MKLDIDQDFLDVTVFTAEIVLLDYIANFQFESLDDMVSHLCKMRCRMGEKRDVIFDNWIKERTPRVRFSEIRSSSNEIIPEYDTNIKW